MEGGVAETYPDSTHSTRFSIKKEPMMMRGMKYNQFQVFPEASLLCRVKEGRHVRWESGPGGTEESNRVSFTSPVIDLWDPGTLEAKWRIKFRWWGISSRYHQGTKLSRVTHSSQGIWEPR